MDEHHEESATTSNKPSCENVPVDLDEFPSVYREDEVNKQGIPNTVFATPFDDLSTIDNDTIGHTVHPWDFPDGQHPGANPRSHPQFPRYHQQQQQQQQPYYPQHASASASLPHSKLPPELGEFYEDYDVEMDNRTPVTGVSSAVGGGGRTTQVTHFSASTGGDAANKNNPDNKNDEDRRRWRYYMIAAIVGPILSALIVGVAVALILTGEKENGNQSAALVPPSPAWPSATNVPTISPVVSPTAPPIDISGPVTKPPVVVGPTPTLPPTASPTTSAPVENPQETPTPTVVPQTPTAEPTTNPTIKPTLAPTPQPTVAPTSKPITVPSASPTRKPTLAPTPTPIAQSPEIIPTMATLNTVQETLLTLFQTTAPADDYWVRFSENSSSGTTVVSSTSPQWRALEWLTSDPNFSSYTDDRKIQRYALAVFAFGLQSPPDTGTWLDYNTHECDWYTAASSGSSCASNSNGQGALMRRLDLRNSGLTGTLPVELGLLSSALTQIYLQDNALRGTLPAIWGQDLQQLERFQLTSANLEGTLPPAWSQMTALTVLGLGRNGLTGPLPVEWAMGDSGSIVGMSSLSTLGLERNTITGAIPSEWGNGGLPSLVQLFLDSNQLTGRVPDSLWTATNAWETFNVGGNPGLTGVMSDVTCSISTLTVLIADCSSDDIVCHCCTVCL